MRTGLLTGAISKPISLAAPSRCKGISGGCRNGLTPRGARFTVAGQWRSFTALPEHSLAVAVVGQAKPRESDAGRESPQFTRLGRALRDSRSGDDEDLAGRSAGLQIDVRLLGFGE
jgi:hypothetical protein